MSSANIGATQPHSVFDPAAKKCFLTEKKKVHSSNQNEVKKI